MRVTYELYQWEPLLQYLDFGSSPFNVSKEPRERTYGTNKNCIRERCRKDCFRSRQNRCMHIGKAAKLATMQDPNRCSRLFNDKLLVQLKTKLITFARSRFCIEFELLEFTISNLISESKCYT